jgi:hypothetical protein
MIRQMAHDVLKQAVVSAASGYYADCSTHGHGYLWEVWGLDFWMMAFSGP